MLRKLVKNICVILLLAISIHPTPAKGIDYGVKSIPYNPVIPFPATVGTPLSLNDDGFQNIPIGFTFNFYGQDFNTVFVDANGFLSFGAGSGSFIPAPIPTNGLPPAILGFWRDLFPPSGGSIYYTTLGEAPNRQLVVSFNSIAYFSPRSQFVTLQFALNETTNLIELYLQQWTGATVVTQGVQNPPNNATAIPGRNDANIQPSTGPEGWLFGAIPDQPYNAQGFQQYDRFLTQTVVANIVTWEPPLENDEQITGYSIYSDAALTNLIAVVPNEFPLEFVQSNVKKDRIFTYYIVANGANGFSSAPTRVIINPFDPTKC